MAETEFKPDDALTLLSDLIADAKAAGADAADAVMAKGMSVSLTHRLGQLEKLERAEGHDLGLRVLVGRRQAIVSSTDTSRAALKAMADRAVAMARLAPEDPFCGLAEPGQLATSFPDLDLLDSVEPGTEALIERARAAEDAARAVAGVTNSEGADAGWGISFGAMVASNGFAGHSARSWHSVSVSVLAGDGTAMERDYDYHTAVHGADLRDPVEIGRTAGERTVRRLNPRKVETMQVPVIFDRRVAGGLLGHLAGAINGAAIARGTSFLKDMLGKAIFAPTIVIRDDPHRLRGLRSTPYDGEGLPTRPSILVDHGVLQTWLLDLRAARQLGLAPTGHAGRGASSLPSPSARNLYLAPGSVTPRELYADAPRALLITDLMGMGVNMLNGDYSRGAAGFMIEQGEITFPVSEITIAGNLSNMFRNLQPANDLEFRTGIDSPTVRIDGMTIAGL